MTLRNRYKVRHLLPQLLAMGSCLRLIPRAPISFVVGNSTSLSQLYADVRNEADAGWRVIERPSHVIMRVAK